MPELTFPTATVTPGAGLTINSIPNAGQAIMANSLGIAIASDQSVTNAISFNSSAATNSISTFTRPANVTLSTVNVSTSVSPYFTWTAANPPINGQGLFLLGSPVPGGFSAGAVYWAVGVSGSKINLAASVGGAAIVPTSTGTAVTATLSYKPNDLIASSPLTPVVPSFTTPNIAGGVIIPRVRLKTNVTTTTVVTSTPFVTGQTLGTPVRADATFPIGFLFTVGSSPITVTDLGRWVNSGNNQAHTLTIVRVSDRTVMASISVTLSGAPSGTYAYGTLTTPITLASNTAYYMLTSEASGLDTWNNDKNSVLTTTAAAVINNSVWFDGTNYNLGSPVAPGSSFGPVSFKYQSSSTSPNSWNGSILSINLWSAPPTYIGGDAQLYSPASGDAAWLANFLVPLVQFGDGAVGGGTLIGAGQTSLKLAAGTTIYWDLKSLSYVQPNASQTFTLTAECLN